MAIKTNEENGAPQPKLTKAALNKVEKEKQKVILPMSYEEVVELTGEMLEPTAMKHLIANGMFKELREVVYAMHHAININQFLMDATIQSCVTMSILPIEAAIQKYCIDIDTYLASVNCDETTTMLAKANVYKDVWVNGVGYLAVVNLVIENAAKVQNDKITVLILDGLKMLKDMVDSKNLLNLDTYMVGEGAEHLKSFKQGYDMQNNETTKTNTEGEEMNATNETKDAVEATKEKKISPLAAEAENFNIMTEKLAASIHKQFIPDFTGDEKDAKEEDGKEPWYKTTTAKVVGGAIIAGAVVYAGMKYLGEAPSEVVIDNSEFN